MQKSLGFTLIELLVVVLIIGILAAVALPQYEKSVKKTRLMRVAPLVKALADAEEAYWLANGRYTPYATDLDIDFPAGGTSAGAASDDGYMRFSDGTVVDLLNGSAYIGATGSVSSYVTARLKDSNNRYVQYLTYSAYPNTRLCVGEEAVCKSLGGVAFSPGYLGSLAWKLP